MGFSATISRVVRENKGATVFLSTQCVIFLIALFIAIFGPCSSVTSVFGYVLLVLTCICTWVVGVAYTYNNNLFSSVESCCGCMSERGQV